MEGRSESRVFDRSNYGGRRVLVVDQQFSLQFLFQGLCTHIRLCSLLTMDPDRLYALFDVEKAGRVPAMP